MADVWLADVGKQLIPALAYGDAAGLAGEGMSAAQIHKKFGTITGLIAPSGRFHYADKPAGTWSDDTQLSLAVARSLITSDGFDLRSQADELISTYRQTPLIEHQGKKMPLGWGGNTTGSVLRLIDGVPPESSGQPGAKTNGVLMKLAPLIYWHYARGTSAEQRYEQLDLLTRMTHDSLVTALCSRVHADVLFGCLNMRFSVGVPGDFGRFAVRRAQFHEKLLDLDADPPLSQALEYLTSLEDIGPAEILASTDQKGFDAPQTLAIAYGAFLAGLDYTGRVYAGVNLGGDSDSIASIAGTMSLFYDKVADLPEDITLLQYYPALRQLSAEFTAAVLLKS